jgi:hypothetical protein
MNEAMNHPTSLRVRVLSTIAVVLSAASAFSYLGHIGQKVVVGDLLGLPGRQGDAALAQLRAIYWLIACLACLTGSIIAMAVALPVFADASGMARLIGRFAVASICCFAVTVFIGVAAFTIVTALHHSVVR